MNSIDFGGYTVRSKVKFMMGIIDKCGMHRDATLCVDIFFSYYVSERPNYSLILPFTQIQFSWVFFSIISDTDLKLSI